VDFNSVYDGQKKWAILTGDALSVLKTIPDNVLQTTITSPPYYQLRDYGNDQQIGQEQTPKEYIDKLVEIFREVRRCTREDGTCWINMGDKYTISQTKANKKLGLKHKDLMALPYELAIALRNDGWYLRQIYPWVKCNAIPENVNDRPNTSVESVIFLSKSDKYYFDMESAKECLGIKRNWRNGDGLLFLDVPTEPTDHAHFAVMPTELAKVIIKSSTSEKGCCSSCKTPLRRKIKKQGIPGKNDFNGKSTVYYETITKNSRTTLNSRVPNHMKHTTVETLGWEHQCKCKNSTNGFQLVLDPFSGSATSGSVALSLGNGYIGIELNPEYADYSIKRLIKEFDQSEDIFKPI